MSDEKLKKLHKKLAKAEGDEKAKIQKKIDELNGSSTNESVGESGESSSLFKSKYVLEVPSNKGNPFIMIQGGRVNFCQLFDAVVSRGAKDFKSGAQLHMDKENPQDMLIKDALEHLVHKCSNQKFERVLAADKLCLRDGASKEPPAPGIWTMNMSGPKDGVPYVIDQTGNVITDRSKSNIYNGCRCKIKAQIYAQDSSDYGKRINCVLVAIQFIGDDEPLDMRATKQEAMDGFGEVDAGDYGDMPDF